MAAELLERLETMLAADEIDRAELREAGRRARERALAFSAVMGPGRASAAVSGSLFVGDVVGRLATAHAWSRAELDAVLHLLAAQERRPIGLLAFEVHRTALEAARDDGLPPRMAVQATLGLLRAFAPIEEASLWTEEAGAPLRCCAFTGSGPTRRMRAVAREAIASGTARWSERGSINGVPVSRWGQPYGALVVRARPPERDRALVFARETARVVAAELERTFLLERSASRQQRLVAASERRLARLGFDIHDGPIQDVAALAADLRFFRTQLRQGISADRPGDLLVRRVEDFEARLVALDRELRELAHSLERTSAVERPFADVLRSQIAAFTTRNDVTVKLDLRGYPEQLTTSQRLSILAFVREALVNVRDHSGAGAATIIVSVGRARTHAAVLDDGRGFDVERTLVEAARRGRLGLVGMSERMRMLGGRLQLESKPGGPTRVAITVPRWDPACAPARDVSAA
jgi:signal transduction histidine kinase